MTVYECDCGARAVGRQRCTECGTFMRRVGIGGACPHCDEPVAVVELVGPEVSP
jgi:DNA polymerase II large subunit